MEDMTGILKDYLPLQLVGYGDVYADEEGDENAWLNEYDFIWKPKVDSEDTPQVYLGDQTICFITKGRDKRDALKNKIGDKLLRLPKISNCWGKESLMMADELAEALTFSEILGVTRTKAEIIDAAGDKRQGYTAFSFHKVLFHERIETRLEHVSAELRPIIKVFLKAHSSTYLIHKDVLEKWQHANVEDVAYNIDDEHRKLRNLERAEFYYGSSGNRDFSNMEDFLLNQNPRIY